MAETFFAQLDSDTLRALLGRTALSDAALVMVGPTMHIEFCNKAAARLTGLHPLERVDQLLSETAAAALRDCIERKAARTVLEELDGAEYRLELLPHREGALLAFLKDDRVQYDGSLRVLHMQTAQFLLSMLPDIEQVGDPALAQHMRRQCMRMLRTYNHSDTLHEPFSTEQLNLHWEDLSVLCSEAVHNTQEHTSRRITLNAPEQCRLIAEPDLIRRAVYNLLTNAVQASPAGGLIEVTVHDDPVRPSVTVADRGPGLDAALFDTLLSGWQRPFSYEEYLALGRDNVKLGLGMPYVQHVARLHGGSLLLSPREGGGSELHLVLSHLSPSLADTELHAPPIVPSFPPEVLELSVL